MSNTMHRIPIISSTKCRVLIMFKNLSTNARKLICSKSCSIFKLNVVTDYCNSSCQSNPINSTFNTETISHRFRQTSVLQNKLPYIMQLLLTSKHNRKCTYGTFSNTKTAHLQRQQYQPRNDHQNSTSRNALDYLSEMSRRG